MVVPEQDEVGLKARQVDLDLVYIGVPGLHLLDAGMSNEQVGLVCAPRLVGLLEGLQSGVDAQHLGDGVDDEGPVVCTDLKALVGQAGGQNAPRGTCQPGRCTGSPVPGAEGCRGCR